MTRRPEPLIQYGPIAKPLYERQQRYPAWLRESAARINKMIDLIFLPLSKLSMENSMALFSRLFECRVPAQNNGCQHGKPKYTEENSYKEAQLQAMLIEKEVLLKEIHHRVKNNLQIVNSILSLKAEKIHDPQALQAFQECQNNVRAIASVHENLYTVENLTKISASECLPGLIQNLSSTFSPEANDINVEIDIAPVSLDLDSAIPCSLIITELFTNIAKHAFPDWRSTKGTTLKQAQIRFYEEGPQCVLLVRDNGVGLPSGYQIENAKTLGLPLVRLLTHQLNGQMVWNKDQDDGTSFKITFPIP